MIYKAKNGSRLSDKKANIYGQAIEEFIEQDGGITPESLTSYAKDKNSVFHDWFEWDNKKAAHQYRLTQAREMLRSIQIVVQTDQEEVTVRAFHPVVIGDKKEDDTEWPFTYSWQSTQRIYEDGELERQIDERFKRELKAFINKFRNHQSLAKHIEILNGILTELDTVKVN